MLDQQQQEQEQQQVGQDVVPPGASTTVDAAEQVEPKFFSLKRSMVVSPFLRGTSASYLAFGGRHKHNLGALLPGFPGGTAN
jgi:hypothetical protein